jgi:TatA/E family protein of Tat protein translocase
MEGNKSASAPVYRTRKERSPMMDLFAPTHLIVALAIVLVLFGPSKLGDVGGAVGRAIHDFKKAMNDQEAPNPSQPSTVDVRVAKP